jgi:hypothetical protein
VDHAPPHHFRLRDRAICRDLGRFLAPFDRVRPRPGSPGASHPDRGGGGRPGHYRYAGPPGRGVGVAQLEVSQACPRRRHDLRPLDADAEAAPSRRRADLDRRLEGGRPYHRRRPVRRRRGWSQSQAPGRSEGPGAPGRASGQFRGSRGRAPPAPPAPAGRVERPPARNSGHRRPAGLSRQAGTHLERPTKAAQASPGELDCSGSRRRAGRRHAGDT